MNDLWIIGGCSPFLDEYDHKVIQELVNKYPTIGVNAFCCMFSNCQYVTFADEQTWNGIKDYVGNSKVIVWEKGCGLMEDNFNPNSWLHEPYIVYRETSIPILEEKSELFKRRKRKIQLYMADNSAIAAINYALLKGAKNILLIGVDFTKTWYNVYNKTVRLATDKYIAEVRNALYKFKEYLNIYSLNPNTDLDVKLLGLKDLLGD